MKTYKHNKKRVPRVTTIIGILSKPFLSAWANKMGLEGIVTKDYVKRTAAIGTIIHEIVEFHMALKDLSLESINKFNEKQTLLSNELTEDERYSVNLGVIKYLNWFKNNDIKDVRIELPLTCSDFGGTLDVICTLNGVKGTLLDIKTSKRIYDSHELQVSAYCDLARRNEIEINQLAILRLGVREDTYSDAEFKTIPEEKIKILIKKFKNCLEIYNLNKEIKDFEITEKALYRLKTPSKTWGLSELENGDDL